MKKKNILITGGAGYIGSYVNWTLNKHEYNTIILDNLSRGSAQAVTVGTLVQGDLADPAILDNIFKTFKIDAVLHFAAFTDVGESISHPLKYYQNNVVNTVNLLDGMQKHGIQKFIFSSTAAIFGIPQTKKIDESHPCHPINPYGQSKLIIETILSDLDKANKMQFCALRYFNAAGGDPAGHFKNYNKNRKESNLIPIVLKSIPHGIVTIYGNDYPTKDGTCIRDYIHLDDLAHAHLLALEQLLQGAPSNVYNLGNGEGFSVKEVIAAAEMVTGKSISVKEGERRAGDPPILVADSQKAARELRWSPRYPELKKMILDSWNGFN